MENRPYMEIFNGGSQEAGFYSRDAGFEEQTQ